MDRAQEDSHDRTGHRDHVDVPGHRLAEAADRGSDASTQEDVGLQAASESELAELAETQEEHGPA
ncbi:MAG: hypothetical protein M3Q47_12550 [Actinomycetota bacterium]|nr:hypothetical protein [Actinomycetota bacterium]